MPSIRIQKELTDQVYFITFTVKNWYYVFDRHNRFEILEKSFIYCQKNKELKVYSSFSVGVAVPCVASAELGHQQRRGALE